MITAQRFGICPKCWSEIREGEQIGTPDDDPGSWMHTECLEEHTAAEFGQLIPFPHDRTALYFRTINSADYRMWKAELIIRRGRKCAMCGRQDLPFQLHHNSYEHLLEYREHPEDITMLCSDCHARHHGLRAA